MKYLKIIIAILVIASCQTKKGEYICSPCDLPCDKLTFEEPGICPHCKMTLIKKDDLIAEINLVPNEVDLKIGSGVFLVGELNSEEDKSFKVYYHKPQNFSDTSRILLVIPGTGRDGDEYRDAWVENAEKYNVLILSPMFEEEKYPFEDYHLCGLIKNVNLEQAIEYVEGTNQARLNDDAFSFEINTNNQELIFNRLDKMFDLVVEAEKSKQKNYDIFGHSAGGQILHRMAILHNNLKVNKIIAANSGFYTLPDNETPLPFGTGGLHLTSTEFTKSFSNKLTIMVGALDNENETKGTLLRSSIVDKQGTHRLARANYFFNFSQSKAKELEADFNWKIKIIPGVGHDSKLVGNAAAKLLYE